MALWSDCTQQAQKCGRKLPSAEFRKEGRPSRPQLQNRSGDMIGGYEGMFRRYRGIIDRSSILLHDMHPIVTLRPRVLAASLRYDTMLLARAPGATLLARLSHAWDGIIRHRRYAAAVGSSSISKRDESSRWGASAMRVRSREKIGSGNFVAILLAVLGFFGPAVLSPSATAAASSSTCSTNAANDIKYLLFWPPLPGASNESLAVDDFAAKLGTTGDGTTRQLGFGDGIPVWVGNDSTIVQAIKRNFDTAKRTNVAVHFVVDDHVGWDKRPDLWNWYDPAKRGYNPDNKKNVEWYDWEGTANKRRYFSPEGTPSQSPHMCYNSPTIRKEISRIVSNVIGPALRKEIDKLKQQNKEYLFAGITVGAEAGFDDYSMIENLSRLPSNPDPMQRQVANMLTQAATLMDEDEAPHSRLGYCSLTNAGYSKTNPPADINRALADVSQKVIEFWDKQFFDAGIPCSRIYTHVAASPPQDNNNNAPIRIVFNPYARPGWTTYPIGTLENGFRPLYDELAKHGNPAWGGVEAHVTLSNPNAAVRTSWEEYLAWHYNHGAKLVGINVGASDESLMSQLSKGAFGEEAMAAYKKFLKGERLIER